MDDRGFFMKLAFFVGDAIQSYESGLIRELQRITKEKGYRLDIFANSCVPGGDYLHVEGLKKVFYISELDKYDGIITADDTLHNFEMNIDLRRHLLENARSPIVSLRNSVEGYYNVVIDDRYEVYRITRHLLEKHGCRKIGFVTGSFEFEDSASRLSGFEDAMADAGFIVDEEDLFYGNYWNDQGDETADYFIRRSKGLPEAIICSNDCMAIALIEALKKRGIECPKDIIVTGLDNTPEGIQNIPALTTIDFDTHKLVGEAISIIEDLKAGKKIEKKRIVKGKCIFRSSCGCTDVNHEIVHTYKIMKDMINEELDNAMQCVSMNINFGGVLEDEECIRWALQILKRTGKFSHVYTILRNKLYAELDEEGNINLLDEEIDEDYVISKCNEEKLNGKTNVFFPINCQEKMYGYFVIQLADGVEKYFDEVMAQLLITVGNTFKKLELLSYQGELKTIKRLYQRDALTDLYNRRGFERKIRELYELKADDVGVAISSIDADGLKYINDTFGHFEGDKALIAIGECIRKSLDEGEFAARIGGDEYSAVILLKNGKSIDEFRNRVYANVKRKASDFKNYPIGVSVGIAEVKSYRTIVEAMKLADEEMYKEKQLHHGTRD